MKPSTKTIIVTLIILVVAWSGCTEKHTVTISENNPPTLILSANPTTGYQPLTVSFDINAEDSDGTITSCIIDFGDGTSGNESNASHVYEYGSYTATVTVADNQDAEVTDNVEIIVKNHAPTVFIQTNRTTGETLLPVSFGCSAYDLDGVIVSWSWDFGDGTHAETDNTSHIFSTPGDYTIQLIVTDNNGGTAIAKTDVTIEQAKENWELTLKGATTVSATRKQFEQLVEVYGQDWSDGDNTWNGVPLWHLIAIVDDMENKSSDTLCNYTFNETLANEGYIVRITAGDGFVITLRSTKISHEDGYLVTDTINGEPLPARTPRDRPSWPLHMRGDKAHQPYNIGNINTIEIVSLNESHSLWSIFMRIMQLIKGRS